MAKTLLFFLLTTVFLSACVSNTSYAPVEDAWHQPQAQQSNYIVRRGDTIYSIAWSFGLDYRALAAANHLTAPYAIQAGQSLRMQTAPRSTTIVSTGQEKIVRVYSEKTTSEVFSKTTSEQEHSFSMNKPISQWTRPARGSIIQGFSSSLAGNHGIDISGRLGEPVRAAASGEVVYSGDGVRGYGNLLILKHNESYLSAYAFNKKILVSVGQQVQAGQQIAEMGKNDAGRVLLHFEIRQNGQPVNPERYLRS